MKPQPEANRQHTGKKCSGLQRAKKRRRGLSLLEMMIATVTMATLMASVVVLVRSGHAAWDTYEKDVEITNNGYATLRHITRRLRQADAVTAISTTVDSSGTLSIVMSGSATTYTWDHDDSTDYVYFDNGTLNQLLSWKINQLTFIGYEADGTTQTTVTDDIQIVECRLRVTLPHGGGEAVILSSRGWLRSW